MNAANENKFGSSLLPNWSLVKKEEKTAKNVVQPVVQTLLRFAAYAGNIGKRW
jgi:hypothetical protein